MSIATAPETEIELRHVGKRTPRADAPERLTGTTRFTTDLALPGLLHAHFVRSPYAAARLLSVDGSAAMAVPGVVAVYTARDLPVVDIAKAVDAKQIMLALDYVRYAGHAVAVVLAETEAAAEDGAALVQVEYEEMSALSDLADATAPDARAVKPKGEVDQSELAQHGATAAGGQAIAESKSPNVNPGRTFSRGDVAQGFAESDVVVERSYTTSWVHQGYIEPQATAAVIDPLGNLVIYTGTQAMFGVRATVSRVLGIPDNRVRVESVASGGAFGGKFGLAESTIAALAVKAKRSVAMVYTRMNEFVAACPAPQGEFRVKVGAKKDGTLLAVEMDVLFDSGSHPGAPVFAGMIGGSTYKWQHVKVSGSEVMTNKAGTGAYRAPGVPQICFALESTIDDLAAELGVDPFDLRRNNSVGIGDTRADGVAWANIGLPEVVKAAEPLYRAEMAAKGPNEGVGVAIGGWPGGLEPCTAFCRLNSDGTLSVLVGSSDISGVNTSFALIAAEAFGMEDAKQVRVLQGSTDTAPHAGASGGSKTMYTVGKAVQRAAEDAKDQVLRIASDVLEAAVEDLEIKNGSVSVKGVPAKTKKLSEIYQLSGSFGARFEPVHGTGKSSTTTQAPGFTVQIARVRVDPDTGEVHPIRLVAVQDVGKAINPASVEGQIHGGAVQAVGYGLWERMVFDSDGTSLTGSLLDYTLPKATQSPEVEVHMVEVASVNGPYGARGVGEPPITAGAAALANAVRDATGARVTSLPLTAERVFLAMNA